MMLTLYFLFLFCTCVSLSSDDNASVNQHLAASLGKTNCFKNNTAKLKVYMFEVRVLKVLFTSGLLAVSQWYTSQAIFNGIFVHLYEKVPCWQWF